MSNASCCRLPGSLDDVKRLAGQLQRYNAVDPSTVLLVYSVAYLWKQTFAIPGSMFMNVLGGALFGLPGIPLVLLLNSAGATCCYAVSWLCGGPLVDLVKGHMATLRAKLVTHGSRGRLIYELTLLRMVPIVPNWFVNIASPHLHIPVGIFFGSVLVGMAPFTVLSVQAGLVVHDLAQAAEMLAPEKIAVWVAVAAVALIPAIYTRVYK